MYWLKIPLTLLWLTIITLSCLVLYALVPWVTLHKTQLTEFTPLAYGMIAYIVFRSIIPNKSLLFFDVFFHELSHGIFALLTFSGLKSFVVSPHSGATHLGYIEHIGSSSKPIQIIRAHLVSLAPYFFSPITVLILGLYYLLLPYSFGYVTTMQVLLWVIGFSYLYHLSVSFSDMRPYQSDFEFLGFKYSLIFVIMMQLVFLISFILILSNKLYSYYQFKLILHRQLYELSLLWNDIQGVIVEMWVYIGRFL